MCVGLIMAAVSAAAAGADAAQKNQQAKQALSAGRPKRRRLANLADIIHDSQQRRVDILTALARASMERAQMYTG